MILWIVIAMGLLIAFAVLTMRAQKAKGSLTIQLENRIYRSGEQMSGAVLVTARQPITATALTLKLEVEMEQRKSGQETEIYTERFVIAQQLSLPAGTTRLYPFSLTIPDFKATYEGLHPPANLADPQIGWNLECELEAYLEADGVDLQCEMDVKLGF